MKTWTKKEIIDYMESKKPETVYKIKLLRKKRTLSQNNLMHVLFSIMKDQEIELWNNYTMDQIKYSMKCFIFWTVCINMWGVDIPTPCKNTSDLDVLEWKEFIEQQIEFLNNNYWLDIVWPEDKRLLEYYDKYVF